MTTRDEKIASSLLVVALIGLVVGLLPNGRRFHNRVTGERVTEWKLGFDFSPVWEYEEIEQRNGSFKTSSGFRFPSWSWIPLIIGITCLHLRRRMVDSPEPVETNSVETSV